MNIKTKFNVNDLIQHKFSKSSPQGSDFYEVKEVHAITCYTGTQVFYHCRRLGLAYLDKRSLLDKKKNKMEVIDVLCSIVGAGPIQYAVLREDEVKACSKEISKHVK